MNKLISEIKMAKLRFEDTRNNHFNSQHHHLKSAICFINIRTIKRDAIKEK